jgi:hypothetical protein
VLTHVSEVPEAGSVEWKAVRGGILFRIERIRGKGISKRSISGKNFTRVEFLCVAYRFAGDQTDLLSELESNREAYDPINTYKVVTAPQLLVVWCSYNVKGLTIIFAVGIHGGGTSCFSQDGGTARTLRSERLGTHLQGSRKPVGQVGRNKSIDSVFKKKIK